MIEPLKISNLDFATALQLQALILQECPYCLASHIAEGNHYAVLTDAPYAIVRSLCHLVGVQL